MNDLESYFKKNDGNLISKWHHYFDVYERHFARYRGKEVYILEIGVWHGGSLQMWKHYFGPKAKIYGVDINPHCKELEEDQIKIFIGDQCDRKFLKSLIADIPRIDILIDDGGHTMEQQIATFEVLFTHIAKDGVYLSEDLHTSYWARCGGGYRSKWSFIEYSKNLIDCINAWHSERPKKLQVSEFTRTAHSLHYYDSMFVIEKRPMEKPCESKTGNPRVPRFAVSKPAVSERVRKWFHNLFASAKPRIEWK